MADLAIPAMGTAYALTAASYLVILSRILLRRLKHEAFKPDDYLMLFATVLYVIFTASFIVAAYHGTNLSQSVPMKLQPDQIQYVILGSKFLLVSRVFYTSYLWTLKTCMLIYYCLRLPLRTKELLAIKMAAVSLAVTWVVCMLTFFLECIPVKLYWQVLPGVPKCAKAISAVIVNECTNILTNLVLMAIPFPIILRPIPPTKERIRLSALYLVGFIVIIISAVRIITVLMDLTEQNELIWGQLECFIATALVNAPVIHGLYRHSYNHIRKRKFGRNHCTPEYELAIREPMESRDSVYQRGEEQQPAGPAREEEPRQQEQRPSQGEQSRLNRMSDGIRKSVVQQLKSLTDRVKSSFERLEIECKVEIAQESKMGFPEPAESPDGLDVFCGPPGAHLGHISTRVFTGNEGPTEDPKHHHRSRLRKYMN